MTAAAAEVAVPVVVMVHLTTAALFSQPADCKSTGTAPAFKLKHRMSFSRAARFLTPKLQPGPGPGPGPGSYQPKLAATRPSAPAFSFCGRQSSRPAVQNPGTARRSKGVGYKRELEKVELDLCLVDQSESEKNVLLGSGGLAHVKLAKYAGHFVAAKLWWDREGLLPGQEAKDREALKQEAELLYRLDHPHIIKSFAIIEENGQVAGYLMELLRGSLHEAASKGRLSHELLRITVQQACKAFIYLHALPMAHCDVKESNFLLKSTGVHIMLADFDAAMELENEDQIVERLPACTLDFLLSGASATESYSPICQDAWPMSSNSGRSELGSPATSSTTSTTTSAATSSPPSSQPPPQPPFSS